MFRLSLEKRLRSLSAEISAIKSEMSIVGEQLTQVEDEAEELRLRSLVSEIPQAGADYREAAKTAATVRRDWDSMVERLAKLEATQDDLLDKMNEVN